MRQLGEVNLGRPLPPSFVIKTASLSAAISTSNHSLRNVFTFLTISNKFDQSVSVSFILFVGLNLGRIQQYVQRVITMNYSSQNFFKVGNTNSVENTNNVDNTGQILPSSGHC